LAQWALELAKNCIRTGNRPKSKYQQQMRSPAANPPIRAPEATPLSTPRAIRAAVGCVNVIEAIIIGVKDRETRRILSTPRQFLICRKTTRRRLKTFLTGGKCGPLERASRQFQWIFAVLISSIPPTFMKSERNPDGSQFYKDITSPFYGFTRPGATISEKIQENWRRKEWWAVRSVKLLKDGTLRSHFGLPHGMPTTHVDLINADLLAFIRAPA
jgi:hypothetical protein